MSTLGKWEESSHKTCLLGLFWGLMGSCGKVVCELDPHHSLGHCYLGSDSEAGVQEGQTGYAGEVKDVGTPGVSPNPLVSLRLWGSWILWRQQGSLRTRSCRHFSQDLTISCLHSTEEETEAQWSSISRLIQTVPSKIWMLISLPWDHVRGTWLFRHRTHDTFRGPCEYFHFNLS